MNTCRAVSGAITLLPCKLGCQRKIRCPTEPRHRPGSQELPHALGREGEARAAHRQPGEGGQAVSSQSSLLGCAQRRAEEAPKRRRPRRESTHPLAPLKLTGFLSHPASLPVPWDLRPGESSTRGVKQSLSRSSTNVLTEQDRLCLQTSTWGPSPRVARLFPDLP